MQPIFIYVTAPTAEEAKKISKQLLERKLIACANIFPIQSMYWWENKINEDDEFVIIIKTVKKNYQKIKEEIEKNHSYSVPCISEIKVSPNEKYQQWLNQQFK